MSVPGPRREVDDQIVEPPPINFGEELLYHLHYHGAPPDEGGLIVEHETDRYQLDSVAFHRYESLTLCRHKRFLDAHHHGDARSVEVGIEYPYPGPAFREGHGEIYRDSRFAYPPLAACHGDGIFYIGDRLLCR